MDLKSFREDKLKIPTQAAFAELIGVTQADISIWEESPDSIPWPVIQKIMVATNVSLEEVTGWSRPKPMRLEIDNSWVKAEFTKRSLADYITAALDSADIPEEQCKAYVDDLRSGLANYIVKPQVAVVGRSDTGKSTLINALIGADKMPTAWTPTTSIAVYIKHISDKPAFMEENAWIFSNQVGEERLWDEGRLYDEEYCRLWKIGAGEVDVLRLYGTRQGECYDQAAGAAVVFLDAPILNTCDIIDLPGFGTETESDDNITFAAAQKTDVIIYLSQANGFMRIEDITYLKRNIAELPVWEKKGKNGLAPLSNLFVVASQAHTINNGNREQLNGILDAGCANLLKTLPEGYWKNRQASSGYGDVSYGQHELRSRFFGYTIDIPDICTPFNNALTQVLEALPIVINERAKEFVRSYVKARKPNLTNELEKYENLVRERDKYIVLLNEINRNELSRVQDNDKRKMDIRSEIHRLSEESVQEFSQYLGRIINADALAQLLKESHIKNKKEEIEQFLSSLQTVVQQKCESILTEKSEVLSQKTADYVTAYTKSISHSFELNSLKVDFDAGWAFTSALSKLGLIGGLGGLLASTISGTVLFLGLGLSAGMSVLGGLVTSSIFGPIGIGVGLALAGAMGIIKLFGGGWEKTVSKKTVESFEANKYSEKFRDGIRKYWQQMESTFDRAATALDEDWAAYVNNLQSMTAEQDIEVIQHKIASLKVLSDFFDNIPL